MKRNKRTRFANKQCNGENVFSFKMPFNIIRIMTIKSILRKSMTMGKKFLRDV